MTGHWIITTYQQTHQIERTIYHKDWKQNTIVGAEAITLLELLEVISKKCRNVRRGTIKIGFDNAKAYNNIVKNLNKPTQYAQDAGAEIARIKELIKDIAVRIELKLIKHSKKITTTFQQQPLHHLINRCHQKARDAHQMIQQHNNITNIKYQGTYGIRVNGEISTNSIKELIRTCDGRAAEMRYSRCKLNHSYDMVDHDARVTIPKNKVTTSMIKCVYGYNHYGLRNKLINQDSTDDTCPRCSEVETWEHIVTCQKTAQMRKEFITNLAKEMIHVDQNDVPLDDIFAMMEDILIFLEGGDTEDYETNQQMVGMTYLFRGYVIKVWKGVNFNQDKYRILNKILIKHCVMYYVKCWKDRNEHYHDEEKQKQRAIQCKRDLEQYIQNNENINVRQYIERTNIDEQRCNSITIFKWIYSVKDVIKKVKQIPRNDIRRYFEI